jgi:hypothetical protein
MVGTKAFQASYNGSSVFADLVSTPLASGANGSNSASQTLPPIGTTPIVGPVSTIPVEFDFVLSAGDLASGTGVFTVVPELTTMVQSLVGNIGMLFVARSRRRARC